MFLELINHTYDLPLISVGLAVILIVYHLVKPLFSPLRNVPGPTLARFTRLWELYQNFRGQFEHVTIALHEGYGFIVRLAPNRYSISDPSAIRTIYGPGSKFSKSEYYIPFGGQDLNHKDVFSEIDNAKHAAERRKTANMYAMSSLVSYELFVDKVNATFMNALAGHAKSGKTIDLFDWMQFYAFDVIGEITLGRSFGLLEAGQDKDGLLASIHTAIITYGSNIGLLPELHPFLLWLQTKLPFSKAQQVIQRVITREIGARATGEVLSDREDFMAKCMKLSKEGRLDQPTINNVIGANIGAGSDTTGISLTAIVYFLTKHPSCLEKLRREIAEAIEAGEVSCPITYQQGQKLSYLQAVIKESLRLHPAVGQILARVVPEGGVELAGMFFPQGTVVGINAWVIHHDKNIWGADAEDFKPERWLAEKDQVAYLDQHFMAFGLGARTCIGKNISMLEMTKLLPEVVQRFDFEIEPTRGNEAKKWRTSSGWFVKQKVRVAVKERGAK